MSIINNNEAIGVLALQSIVTEAETLQLSNCLIALPLLLDKKIRGYLKRKSTKILSAQQIITDKNEYFVGFNDKFKDYLLTTSNAIVMGVEMGLFSIEENCLVSRKPYQVEPKRVSKTLDEINQASRNAASLLKEEPKELYSLLRIKL